MVFGKKKRKDPFKEIQECLQKRDYKGALDWFHTLLQKDPKNTQIRLRFADVLVLAGNKREAVKQLRKVADGFADKGFMIRAIAINKKILQIDPSQTDVHEKLAEMREERHETPERPRLAEALRRPGEPLRRPEPEEPEEEAAPAPPPAAVVEAQSDPEPAAASVSSGISLEESMAMEFGDASAKTPAEAQSVPEPIAADEPEAPAVLSDAPAFSEAPLEIGDSPDDEDDEDVAVVSLGEGDEAPELSIELDGEQEPPASSPEIVLEMDAPSAPEPEPEPEILLADLAPAAPIEDEPIVIEEDQPEFVVADEEPLLIESSDDIDIGDDAVVDMDDVVLLDDDAVTAVAADDQSSVVIDDEPVMLSSDEAILIPSDEEAFDSGGGIVLGEELEVVEFQMSEEPDMAEDESAALLGALGEDIDSLIDSIIDDVGSSSIVAEPEEEQPPPTHIPLFSDLTTPEFIDVALLLVRRVFKPDEVAVKEGDPGDSMFIISTGEVRASVDRGGQSLPVATLKDGDFFGEMSVLTNEPRTATVTAVKKTEVLELSRDNFLEICRRHPHVEAKVRLAYDERVSGSTPG